MSSSPIVGRPCASKILGFTLGTVLEMRGSTQGVSPSSVTWKKIVTYNKNHKITTFWKNHNFLEKKSCHNQGKSPSRGECAYKKEKSDFGGLFVFVVVGD
jgi:hypothetical protein